MGSPDGNLLYFVSDRDGFRCIWAQRRAQTKRPIDRPFAVYHFHQTSRRLSHNVGRIGVAVARDKIVLALEELRGNVWMLEPLSARAANQDGIRRTLSLTITGKPQRTPLGTPRKCHVNLVSISGLCFAGAHRTSMHGPALCVVGLASEAVPR